MPVLIENCHDEQQPAKPIADGGCEDYHTYRASTDIRNTYGSWVLNAYSVQQYTDGRTGPGPLSLPRPTRPPLPPTPPPAGGGP